MEEDWEEPKIKNCSCGARAIIDEFLRSDSADCVCIRCTSCSRTTKQDFYTQDAIDELAEYWNSVN